MLTLELTFDYSDERTARAVLSAVSPENGGYVEARLEGNTIFYRMQADNAGTLRNTADDLLACIKAAEESAGLVTSHFSEEDD